MSYIYIFDVDGTLAPSGEPMKDDVARAFYQFTMQYQTYIATGNKLQKLCELIPRAILNKTKGIFTCSGSQFHTRGIQVYSKRHRFPPILDVACEAFVDQSSFVHKSGRHLEHRVGVLNVSMAGSKATKEQRLAYVQWDKLHHERDQFIHMINNSKLRYEAFYGGDVSVDIMPSGWDKSSIAIDVMRRHPATKIAFIGNQMGLNGNDRPLAVKLKSVSHLHQAIAVKNERQTLNYVLTHLAKQAQFASY